MALINCEECGKEISDKAISCPHCGAPLIDKKKKQSRLPYNLQLIAPLLILIIIIFSCSGSGNSASSRYHSNTNEDAEMKEVIRKLDALDAAKEKNSHY